MKQPTEEDFRWWVRELMDPVVDAVAHMLWFRLNNPELAKEYIMSLKKQEEEG